jgi:hypothetical protein
VEFEASLPSRREAFELVKEGEVCSTTQRSLPRPLMFEAPLQEITGMIRRRRSSRRAARESYAFRADMGTVHAHAGQVEFACRVQLGEQEAMQLLEDPRPLPALQTADTSS